MNAHQFHLADENYFESFRVLIDNMKKGHSFSSPQLKYTDIGLAAQFFNNVFLFSPYENTDERIQQAHDYFTQVERPYRLVVREQYQTQAHEAAQSLDLKKVDMVPIMSHHDISELSPPEDFDWKVVGDQQTLNDYREVMGSAFEFPQWLVEKVLSENLLNEKYLVMVVAYEEGVPCTGAMLIQQSDLAGIYWVGTKKGFERKGLAEKATRQAIIIGRDRGCHWAVLQASDKGEAVYKRMGFETQGHYHYQVYQPAMAQA